MSEVKTTKCIKCKNVFKYQGWSTPSYCSNCINDKNADKRHKELMSIEKEKLKLEKQMHRDTQNTEVQASKVNISNSQQSNPTGTPRMHWIFFIFLGMGLGTAVACLILPLFFKGGRKLVAMCYGYW